MLVIAAPGQGDEIQGTPAMPFVTARSGRVPGSAGRARLILRVLAATAGFVFAAAAIWLSVSARPRPVAWWVIGLADVIGLLLLGSGVLLWVSRPESARMARLVLVFGVAWYFPYLQLSANPVIFRLGFLLFFASMPVATHVLFAAPQGRLTRPAERWLVVAVWAAMLVTQGMRILYEHPLQPQIWGSPSAALSSWARAGDVLALILIIVGFALVAQRWRREPAPARHARALFWIASGVYGVTLAANFVVTGLRRAPVTSASMLLFCYLVALLTIAVAMLAGIIRTLVTSERNLARLLDTISRSGITTPALEKALARALEDGMLELRIWSTFTLEYADSKGRPAPLPADGGRAVTEVTGRDGEPLAALLHDPFLQAQPQHRRRLAAAGAAARLLLERLQLDLDTRLLFDDLGRAERAVEIKMERLHDEVQNRLSFIQGLLGKIREDDHDNVLPAKLGQVAEQLQAAVVDLRAIIADLPPPDLEEGGLALALGKLFRQPPFPMLLRVSPDRFDPNVEDTAFRMIIEAVGNAQRHAHATQITIDAGPDADGNLWIRVADNGRGGAGFSQHGGGLRRMRARIRALGGTFTLGSTSCGTAIEAVIPCG